MNTLRCKLDVPARQHGNSEYAFLRGDPRLRVIRKKVGQYHQRERKLGGHQLERQWLRNNQRQCADAGGLSPSEQDQQIADLRVRLARMEQR